MIDSENIAGAVIALLGALVGSVSGIAVTYISKYFDDRRQIRQLALDIAIQQWKAHLDLSEKWGNASGRTASVGSLDSYMVHMLKFAELISSKKITTENVEAELRRIRDISREACKAAE